MAKKRKLVTPVQIKIMEELMSQTISTGRWFVIWGTFTEDGSQPPVHPGSGPQFAEIRHGGAFDALHQDLFERCMAHVLEQEAWICVFGTLNEADQLATHVRCHRIPQAEEINAAVERLVFSTLGAQEHWSRRLPINESLYMHIAKGAYEAMRRRHQVSSGGVISGQLSMPGGIIIGHGIPRDRPPEDNAVDGPSLGFQIKPPPE